MAVSTSLRPIKPRQFDYLAAQHLLNRAAFGGTPQQIMALQQMGLEKAVDYLIDYQSVSMSHLSEAEVDADIIRPMTREEREAQRQARRKGDQAFLDQLQAERQARLGEDRRQMADLAQWWLGHIISTPRPTQEKLVLLWHSHFASNHRTVRDSYLMLKQNDMFREHANGSFVDLARGIVHDPAMLSFLNNDRNNKSSPNENLARELMELFTLGEGNYTEADIKEGARALTGYTYRDNDFVFQKGNHDDGQKTILGKSAKYDGDGFVDLLLQHPACGQFIAYKLYKHFVSDLSIEPSREQSQVMDMLAAEFRRQRYEIAPTLKTLFMSEHFYDRSIIANKIKSPVQLLVGSIRVLNTPVRDLGMLNEALGRMGQQLFDPPSVAGWDGGRSWINTSTLFVRQNLCVYLLTSKLPYEDGWTTSDIDYDPAPLLEGAAAKTPEAIVDHLIATLLGGKPSPARRSQFIDYLGQRTDPTDKHALIGLLLLITATPEYQLC